MFVQNQNVEKDLKILYGQIWPRDLGFNGVYLFCTVIQTLDIADRWSTIALVYGNIPSSTPVLVQLMVHV